MSIDKVRGMREMEPWTHTRIIWQRQEAERVQPLGAEWTLAQSLLNVWHSAHVSQCREFINKTFVFGG